MKTLDETLDKETGVSRWTANFESDLTTDEGLKKAIMEADHIDVDTPEATELVAEYMKQKHILESRKF